MRLVAISLGCLAALAAGSTPAAADHRDGPLFPNTAVNGRLDIGDIFVFRSPSNANNTVLIMTVSPFPGNLSPATLQRAARYDIKVDSSGDSVEDLTLRTTVGQPDGGVQPVTVRCVPAPRCPNRGLLARGKTGQNLAVAGGGLARVAIQDDPFFFDEGGWGQRVAAGTATFPRPAPANANNPMPGDARNFYGPNVNIFAITIELPSSRLGANNQILRVWARTSAAGAQVDREGRPFVNTGMIPPAPRNNLSRGERRTLFNQARPRGDAAAFGDDMRSVLTSFYGRSAADATALADIFLPDVLIFQVGNPNGYGTFMSGPGGTFLGNGRRLRDDVINTSLNFLTNGAIITDNVPDDNAMRITDGNMGTTAAFPYIGPANLPLNGPGTGPNP